MKWLWVALVLLVGCDNTDMRHANEQAVENIEEQIVFFRYKDTGVCFAYFDTGGHGGPALATVPCEAVATYLSEQGD